MSSPMPSRRGLLAASAWTVPAVVLASSAPAFATSGSEPSTPTCVPTEYLFDWANAAWTAPGGAAAAFGSGKARGVVAPTESRPVSVIVQRQLIGGMQAHGDTSTGNNMQISPMNVGDTQKPGLTMYQRYADGANGVGDAAGQTLTFTFPDGPVKGLSFTITDIDGSANQFHDRVSLSVQPARVTHATREKRYFNVEKWRFDVRDVPTTEGAGTATAPFTSVARSAVNNTTSDDGNVRVEFSSATAINSFQLKFWNGITGSLNSRGQQAIYLSNIRFIADVCA